ncbi:hypothetical protein IJG14_02630 [bacterium]|nr:hypothetical protein [bacterium]
MENKDNIIEFKKISKQDNEIKTNKYLTTKNFSNPIIKKQMIISIKNNIHNFTVSDLFD